MNIPVAVGIDIGGTNTKIGLIDISGKTCASTAIKTEMQVGIREFVAKICTQINLLKGENLEIQSIGIGSPGVNPIKGTIEYSANLGVEQVNLVKLFQEFYTVPVSLTNDANAAAVGEMMFGGAKEMKNFAVVTLGTGLGCGIVANGNLVQGMQGFAGELGHVIAVSEGRQCNCGRKGCLETYASATGIVRTVYQLIAERLSSSKLKSIAFEQLNAEIITQYAIEGDTLAIESFEYTGEILGAKLADLVIIQDPEAIFLFGGLVKAGDLLITPTQKSMEKNLLKMYQNKVKILPSFLQNENVAVLGAAALAWKNLEENEKK
jgi:glucokinase